MTAVVTSVEGKVATVRFDRGGKANALKSELIGGLECWWCRGREQSEASSAWRGGRADPPICI